MSGQEWRAIHAQQFGRALGAHKHALKSLKNGDGCVVEMAPVSGLRVSTLRLGNGARPAAIIRLTKQAVDALGDVGIRVNCVALDPVSTEKVNHLQ